ncbi:hypothetical protein ACXYVX_03820, partial [Mesomycoplasma ovipneumoniae]
PKTRPQRQPLFPSFNPKKEWFKTTYNGEYDIQLKLSNGEASLSLGNTKPKNPLSFLQDFLNNSESTIILGVDVQKKDNNKSIMNIKFYSSESDEAKKPRFTWSREIPTGAKLNFKKGFTFGTAKSKSQKQIDEQFEKLPLSRSEIGITFKGFVLFDTPQTEEEYNKLFEKFRSEYV